MRSAAVSSWRMPGLAAIVMMALARQPMRAQDKALPVAPPQTGPPPQATEDAETVSTITGKTPGELTEQSWQILTDAARDDKHADQRLQALAALGLLNGNPRAVKLIETAMQDHDVDVRTGAVLAAGEARAPVFDKDLYAALADPEPQVAFNAALVLARKKDVAGDDILTAVIGGKTATGPGAVEGAKRTVARQMHHPSSLVRMGALQGAGMFLGPFGLALGPIESLRKQGNNPARVQAVDALASENRQSLEIHDQLVSVLGDKDPALRAAAAKALSHYHDADTAQRLAVLLDDSKTPVRYTGAAAYILTQTKVAATGTTKTLRRRARPDG